MAMLAPIAAWAAANAGTLALASLAVSTVGVVGSTLSSIAQTNQQSAAAEANARAAGVEAQTLKDTAAFEETQQRRRTGLLLGKQAAISAASGVDITSGSPLFAELDNVRQAELEALNVRRTGQLGGSAKDFEARLARFQSDRIQGNIPGIAFGGLAQGGSVLSQFLGRQR